MIVRYVILHVILLWLVTAQAYALGDQELLFVRPSGACLFSGNGKAYDCAASTGALGAWIGLDKVQWSATDATDAAVDPNDILAICGAHLVVSVQTRLRPTVDGNATDGHIITDGGACPGDPGSLDGQDVHARLVWWDSRFYHILKNITVKRSASDFAISGYDSAQQDRDRYLTLDHVIVRDNVLAATAVWFWGARITVLHSQGINNYTDNFYFKGGRDVTFEHNRCTDVHGPADCFQQDSTNIASTGTIKINYNDCDKTGAQDIKYCYLVGPVNGPTEIIGNTAICPTISSSASGCSPILVDLKITEGNVSTAEVQILRNTTRKGWRGITYYRGSNGGFRGQIIGNDVCDAGTLGIWLNSTVDNVLIANNTICRNGLLAAGVGGEHGVYIGKPNSTQVFVLNNLFAYNYKDYYFSGTFGTTPANNSYFGQVAYNIEKAGSGQQVLEGTAQTTDPRFLNYVSDNLKLDGPSPLRQAGTAVAECVSRDGIPCTPTPDIGAYQVRHGGAPAGVLTSAAAVVAQGR